VKKSGFETAEQLSGECVFLGKLLHMIVCIQNAARCWLLLVDGVFDT
jgi:hypothetical protein